MTTETENQQDATTAANVQPALTKSSEQANPVPNSQPELRNSIDPASSAQAPEPLKPEPSQAAPPPDPAGQEPTQPGTAKPSPLSSRPRTGKVARLPREHQDLVNQMMLRRVPYKEIRALLAEKGFPGFFNSNLSNWKAGGFEEFLAQHQSEAQRQSRWDSLVALASAEGADCERAAIHLAINHYYELLSAFEEIDLVKVMTEKPELYFRLNTGLASLVKASKGLEKNSPPASPDKALARPALHPKSEGGLTIEERDAVAASLGIRPPPPLPLKPVGWDAITPQTPAPTTCSSST